ncbi:TetR/AcrR family transcriptional regulator [Shewanella sp. WXL01]|uniref:TetR family transcriptional regulator n=1 Tax=Shewanella maritima TaxID=2520507 RepID=A0A411PLL3_9GAMM|nr:MULTISPECIES: TetR/AcrR family transcriptional regulator [Shewanella]NKF52441.1 TetR/AcrR family transcriptional regulator [Shewanella sp. WXL01]QBF84374.1 TetR family transcriptional regulator [Shewanella maritima]
MTTEEKLLHAADELIKQHGIINFSMSDIPRACGLSRASCYQHFRDKNEILAALCTRELMRNFRAINEQRWDDISGIFTMVLRPLVFNHLKERDQLAIDNAFEQLLGSLELLPSNDKFNFMKQGFKILKSERELGLLKIV